MEFLCSCLQGPKEKQSEGTIRRSLLDVESLSDEESNMEGSLAFFSNGKAPSRFKLKPRIQERKKHSVVFVHFGVYVGVLLAFLKGASELVKLLHEEMVRSNGLHLNVTLNCLIMV